MDIDKDTSMVDIMRQPHVHAVVYFVDRLLEIWVVETMLAEKRTYYEPLSG